MTDEQTEPGRSVRPPARPVQPEPERPSPGDGAGAPARPQGRPAGSGQPSGYGQPRLWPALRVRPARWLRPAGGGLWGTGRRGDRARQLRPLAGRPSRGRLWAARHTGPGRASAGRAARGPGGWPGPAGRVLPGQSAQRAAERTAARWNPAERNPAEPSTRPGRVPAGSQAGRSAGPPRSADRSELRPASDRSELRPASRVRPVAFVAARGRGTEGSGLRPGRLA